MGSGGRSSSNIFVKKIDRRVSSPEQGLQVTVLRLMLMEGWPLGITQTEWGSHCFLDRGLYFPSFEREEGKGGTGVGLSPAFGLSVVR